MTINDLFVLSELYSRELGRKIDKADIIAIVKLLIAKKKEYFPISSNQKISREKEKLAIELIKKRLDGMPMSQILGRRAFWKSEFFVNRHVLDPRPETETIIEVALGMLKNPKTILDLGTGSGCLACSLALEYPNARVIAVDKSLRALKIAKKNSKVLNLNIDLVNSDWITALQFKFDLIVCNPPYISSEDYLKLDSSVKEFEPKVALTPDPLSSCTGYENYHYFESNLLSHLTTGGVALFEVGKDMADNVKSIFIANKGCKVDAHKDLDGTDRVISVLKM